MVPPSIPKTWVADMHKVVLAPDTSLEREIVMSLGDVIDSERPSIAGFRLSYSRDYIPEDKLQTLNNVHEGAVFSSVHDLAR